MMYTNYLSPWRLITLALGIGLLIVGSRVHPAPDWDVGVSLLMAICAYFCAPWVIGALFHREWDMWFPAAIVTWFCVDGVYAMYWVTRKPAVLDLMRDAQWPTSLLLFLICGLIWVRKESLFHSPPPRDPY